MSALFALSHGDCCTSASDKNGTADEPRTRTKYGYDDLSRVVSANCGSVWSQTFGFDAFGNLTKNGSISFQPLYTNPTTGQNTNRFISIPGATVSYDSNGNVLSDGSHVSTFDAENRPVTIDGVGLTYDAIGRMVEQNRSSVYTQVVYAPTGQKLALMTGQTLQEAIISLPGGQAEAVYSASGLSKYRHKDWLGSARMDSTGSRTVASTVGYAPFGEAYSQSGTTDLSFTGQNQDTVASLYDFPAREYSTQGRWPSPDPSGLASAHPTDPRSWNRYAYVLNDPLALVDPLGLDCKWSNGAIDQFGQSEEGASVISCEAAGGQWINGSNCYQSDGGVGPCSSSNGTTADDPGAVSCEFTAEGCGTSGVYDDRANALINAMGNTNVQSLKNPCTLGLFYAGSAFGGIFGGAALSGEAAGAVASIKAATVPLWPWAVRWMQTQVASGSAVVYRSLQTAGHYAQAGCDAMQ